MSEFMNKITEPVQTTTKKEQSPEQKQKPFTGKSLSKAFILTSHTIYTRNNMGQKCEGIVVCGFLMISLKKHILKI